MFENTFYLINNAAFVAGFFSKAPMAAYDLHAPRTRDLLAIWIASAGICYRAPKASVANAFWYHTRYLQPGIREQCDLSAGWRLLGDMHHIRRRSSEFAGRCLRMQVPWPQMVSQVGRKGQCEIRNRQWLLASVPASQRMETTPIRSRNSRTRRSFVLVLQSL